MATVHSFTQGKILSPLLRFSLPILVALLLQAMYGAADLLIVGQFNSSADVSAVATGSQVMHTLTTVITGLSMGTTILLAQKIGQKQQDEAGKVIGSGIFLFGIIALVLTVVVELTAGPLASLMQAPAEAFDKTVEYVRICSAGTIFIVAYNVLGSIFRGLGDSKTPLLAVLIACVLNIAGDLLFVGVFGMATGGAALATVLAQSVSVILCIWIIRRRGLPFSFVLSDIRFHRHLVGRTDCSPRFFGEHFVFGHPGYCQFFGRDCIGRDWRGRKIVRLYHAGPVGFFPGSFGFCGAECWGWTTCPGPPFSLVRHGGFFCY